MNKRKTEKRNKRVIEKVLEKLKPLHVCDVKYGNGYFIFTFGGNMVCHFHLKELPNWKFGIWLNDDNPGHIKHTLFGQVEILIDKFKPSRSDIDCTNAEDFVKEVNAIIAKGGFVDADQEEEFLSETQRKKESDIWNKRYYEHLCNFIKDFNKRHELICLKTRDLGANCMPRYWIDLYEEVGYDLPEEELPAIQAEVDAACDYDEAGREGLPCYFIQEAARGRW